VVLLNLVVREDSPDWGGQEDQEDHQEDYRDEEDSEPQN